jgi:hypothetical protein
MPSGSSWRARPRRRPYDAWKAVFDEYGRVRREYGLVDNGLLRDEDDANVVTIQLDTDDSARAREFLASDSLKEAMHALASCRSRRSGSPTTRERVQSAS